MRNSLTTVWFHWLGGVPCFRVYGKARPEPDWRVISVFATHRRDMDSRWPGPFWRGTCITWTASVIAVGWDFAESILQEQAAFPASRERPVEVGGGRLRDPSRRGAAHAPAMPTTSEILAHECGHTWQALRLGLAYWPVGGAVTLFREGNSRWNHFENQASELGQFGGILNGSVCPQLMAHLDRCRG
jgi:hypothetical protein